MALSAYNFVTTRRGRLVASVFARLERYDPPPYGVQETDAVQQWNAVVFLSGTAFERIVVTNYGPAIATEVDIDLKYTGESPYRAFLDEELFPLPQLHPGQDTHLYLIRVDMDPYPRSVTLAWRDGRRGMQSREVWLSGQQLT